MSLIKQTQQDSEMWKKECRPARDVGTLEWQTSVPWIFFLLHLSQTCSWRIQQLRNTNRYKQKTEDTNPYKGLFYVIKGPGKDTLNKTVNFNTITTLLQPNSSQKYSGSIPIYASKGLVGYLDFHFHQAEMKVQRNPHLVRLEKFK